MQICVLPFLFGKIQVGKGGQKFRSDAGSIGSRASPCLSDSGHTYIVPLSLTSWDSMCHPTNLANITTLIWLGVCDLHSVLMRILRELKSREMLLISNVYLFKKYPYRALYFHTFCSHAALFIYFFIFLCDGARLDLHCADFHPLRLTSV